MKSSSQKYAKVYCRNVNNNSTPIQSAGTKRVEKGCSVVALMTGDTISTSGDMSGLTYRSRSCHILIQPIPSAAIPTADCSYNVMRNCETTTHAKRKIPFGTRQLIPPSRHFSKDFAKNLHGSMQKDLVGRCGDRLVVCGSLCRVAKRPLEITLVADEPLGRFSRVRFGFVFCFRFGFRRSLSSVQNRNDE